MQIVGGKYRSKKLEWVSNRTTRPTTGRVKENIFNILVSMGVDFKSANVLVLFAGSGQMGVECYSRGSKNIFFNDTDENARRVIQKNCEYVGFYPKISKLDYIKCLEFLWKGGGKFDLIFLDPPFADLNAGPIAAGYLLEQKMLTASAVIVVEAEKPNFVFKGFNVSIRKYGRECIYFLTQTQS
jgi:16S rRNA (guanine966-N2)-methyltransferase